MKNYNKTSKYISLILRHKPEVADIVLDDHGWANVEELITNINITMEDLERIVETDSKQRYSFNRDKSKIRANQGHSIKVDVELREKAAPDILFHGTSERSIDGILKRGLKTMDRQYVHLSEMYSTAVQVGKRHGKPVVMIVDAKKMMEDGYKFYISENNVWLTKAVPHQYIQIEKGEFN